jgi:hypothetical protein
MHAPSARPRPLAAAFAVVAGFALASAAPAAAAPQHPASTAPKELGSFGKWVAATHGVGPDKLCYAFTRTIGEDPVTGSGPVLSVTDRPTGRNQVAISNGPPYPKGAGVMVTVGGAKLDFYTAGHDAFARDGHATVAAFERGAVAMLHPPGSHARPLSFSLAGFSAAHAAIRKACPPQ